MAEPIGVIYVITWRYADGSGSGAVSAHWTKEGAETMLSILQQQDSMRNFKVEAIPCEARIHG